jgi:hypothetical protein
VRNVGEEWRAEEDKEDMEDRREDESEEEGDNSSLKKSC